ncbi:hypothetical protein A0J61_01883 [Choanephora cucurbitarum]|uniref:C2H2-type domain-containing protein n=1 Tax=Choanephora cucurbitarum TaxID=101091 RepID=A0A1C7NLU9_9FUNG|nr:hypothetical protein A0J61_01883 [Choanephora cucurbitarum]
MNPKIIHYEQPETPLINEKLPSIDTFAKSDEMKDSVAHYLPPPPNAFNMLYSQHVSPPLTPAVSPSSILFDSMNFKRKFSIDISPFGFGTNLSPSMQDAYRRSSCSAMDSMPPNPTMPANGYSVAVTAAAQAIHAARSPIDYTFLNPTVKKPSRKTSRTQPGPSTQHKHACKYPYCTWSFKRYEHLKRHMLVHTGKRPHVCHFPGCGKSFSRSDNFHAHYRTHTKKANLLQNKTSPKQDLQTTSMSEQVAVCEASTDGSPVTEVMAMPSFEERSYYGHLEIKQPSPSFDMTPYQDIYQRYHSEEPYQQQYMRHFPQQLFPSPTTSSSDDLQSTITSPISPSGTSLLNHEQQNSFYLQTLHSPTSRFSYPMNPYAYQNYPDDIVPLPENTTPTTKPNNNRSNNKSSTPRKSSNDQLKSHICPVTQCQRRFKRLEHLKRHMRIHTLERPFGCSFPNCHKTFSRSDNLSQHMKTHQRVEDRRRKPQKETSKSNLPYPTQASDSSAMIVNMS